MATLKWPSISERRSPTEKASNRFDLDRREMLANGLIAKSGCISGTEMATLSSPTETTSSRIDLDRRGMSTNGLIELTI